MNEISYPIYLTGISAYYLKGGVRMTEDERIEALKALLMGSDKGKIQEALKAISPRPMATKSKSEHSKPICYTTVNVHRLCLCCGSTIISKYEMGKGETMVTLRPDGGVGIIHFTGKSGEISIPCCISHCSVCPKKMKTWGREELEAKFLNLLKTITIKEALNLRGGKADG